MEALAIVLERPEKIQLSRVEIASPAASDVLVDVAWSGISTGTERLLYSGRMPDFPGMGYPLIPGYESVGQVLEAGRESNLQEGDWVFVPGAQCFSAVRGLFGGAASRLVVPGRRATKISAAQSEQGILLALAATAHHALALTGPQVSRLVVGHGVLGRLLARLAVIIDAMPPRVLEVNPRRRSGASGYEVLGPDQDGNACYTNIIDASGDGEILDSLIGRIERGGIVTLAGFYGARVSFPFPAAFMKEACLKVASEFTPDDVEIVKGYMDDGRLDLSDLISHNSAASEAASAYRQAFEDTDCLKMVLSWRDYQ